MTGEGSSSRRKRVFDLYYATRSKSAHIARDLYKPLDPAKKHIRVLELQAGTRDDPVHCTLRQVSLLDQPKPEYETISYVWGDQRKRGTIYLHGRLADVSLSSFRALQRMRLSDQTRNVWIDAICINQTDNLERSQQVSSMAQIYENGTTNLIWLGEDDGGTKRALADLFFIVEDMRIGTNNFENMRDILWDATGDTNFARKALAADVEDWASLMRFFEDPWYSRLWVVQEAALATHNVCFRGNLEFDLSIVLKAAVWMYYHFHSLDFEHLMSSRPALNIAAFAEPQLSRYTLLPESGFSLLSLLVESHEFDATDPRDHVYGVLGLVQRFTGITDILLDLQPDYNVSPATLFASAMKHDIAERHGLDILNQVSHRIGNNRDNFPTWVFRLDRGTEFELDATPLMCKDFQADNGIDYNAELFGSNSHILPARGFVVDKIADLTSILRLPHPDETDATQEMHTFLKPVQAIQQRTNRRVNTLCSESALACTLVSGTDSRNARMGADKCLTLYNAYCTCLDHWKVPAESAGLLSVFSEMEASASEYRLAMEDTTDNRLLFATEKGMLGLGPQSARLGDVVAVLYGVRAPFVLRPVRHLAESDHEFVGECYVHGIMDGEAVEDNQVSEMADMIFHLQ